MNKDMKDMKDTETLRQYQKQVDIVKTQINYLNKDAKTVNLTLAVSIVIFGCYFCRTILDNSQRYQNMLSSGGIFKGDNCL